VFDETAPMTITVQDAGRVLAALGMVCMLATGQVDKAPEDAAGTLTDASDAIVGLGAALRSNDGDEPISVCGRTLVYSRTVLTRAIGGSAQGSGPVHAAASARPRGRPVLAGAESDGRPQCRGRVADRCPRAVRRRAVDPPPTARRRAVARREALASTLPAAASRIGPFASRTAATRARNSPNSSRLIPTDRATTVCHCPQVMTCDQRRPDPSAAVTVTRSRTSSHSYTQYMSRSLLHRRRPGNPVTVACG
jgi:hypothetical protein